MYHLLYRFSIVYVSYLYKIAIPGDRMATYRSCIGEMYRVRIVMVSMMYRSYIRSFDTNIMFSRYKYDTIAIHVRYDVSRLRIHTGRYLRPRGKLEPMEARL